MGVRTMNLVQSLLLAPAALGLLAPIPAQAADVPSLAGASAVSAYAAQQDSDAIRAWQSHNQVSSVAQFSDLQPTDWAYQALSNLVGRYGCVAGYPNGTFQGRKAMTRFEAAALLNACLDRVSEGTDDLRRLQKEFAKELAVLKGRVAGLEAKVGQLEATQFATTTKLQGDTYWSLGGLGFGSANDGAPLAPNGTVYNSSMYGGTTLNYDLRLNLSTSFTGNDLLFIRLRSGNYAASAFNGIAYQLASLDRSFPSATGQNDLFYLDRLYYRFPVGQEFTFMVGPRWRNSEALAISPTYYNDFELLDFFRSHGAPGVYNRAFGGGAAAIWRQKVETGAPFFAASVSFIAPNSNASATTAPGGIMNNNSQGNLLIQAGYQAAQWKATFGWRYGQCGQAANRTANSTQAAGAIETCPNNFNNSTVDVNSFALGLAWTPKQNGTVVPAISVGWGYSALNQSGVIAPASNDVGSSAAGVSNQLAVANIAATQFWSVALQWRDAFIKGNSAGMAVGQPMFVTALRNGQTPQDGNYAWEWWYKVQITDQISVSPALFYLSNPSSAGAATGGTNNTGANVFGALVAAQFKF